MLAKARSCAVIGLEGAIVEVETDISPGLPSFTIVGLPDTAVQESRERVRAAIRNSGYEFPMKRITVNLAPADLKKECPAYDLPIAVGILLSSGQMEADVSDTLFLGELSLEGSVRHTQGVLPMVALARNKGLSTVFVPESDRAEAARERQVGRFRGLGLTSNADMGPMNVREMCPMDEGVRGLLQKATQQLHLWARAFHRVLKVSRTIADLAGSEAIGMAHLAEALQYRPRGLG